MRRWLLLWDWEWLYSFWGSELEARDCFWECLWGIPREYFMGRSARLLCEGQGGVIGRIAIACAVLLMQASCNSCCRYGRLFPIKGLPFVETLWSYPPTPLWEPHLKTAKGPVLCSIL